MRFTDGIFDRPFGFPGELSAGFFMGEIEKPASLVQ